MKAQLVERSERYIQCPRCGDQSSFRVSGVPTGIDFGLWYCKRCGCGISGHLESLDDVEIFIEDEGGEERYILLHVHPRELPLFLVVNANHRLTKAERNSPLILLREIVAVDFDNSLGKSDSIKYAVKQSPDTLEGADEAES